jgi:hypothetical protein
MIELPVLTVVGILKNDTVVTKDSVLKVADSQCYPAYKPMIWKLLKVKVRPYPYQGQDLVYYRIMDCWRTQSLEP